MSDARSLPQRLRVLLAVLWLAACGNPPDDSPQHRTEERLAGTWLREYREEGVQVRRVLVLRGDGRFTESSATDPPGAATAPNVHEGEWTFDGTNLKRRYTLVNGARPSAPMVPFATFELRFDSSDQFTGLDRVHRREIVYRRVGEGTRP